jgi:hypothetical protein
MGWYNRILLVLAIFNILYIGVYGQTDYKIGIGARFGKLNTGVTFKEIFRDDQSIGMELQLSYAKQSNTSGYTLKGFLLDQLGFKVPYIQLPLDFIFGAGLQVGYFPKDGDYSYFKKVNGQAEFYGKNVVTGGVAANIGLEYDLRRAAPFTIGIDAIPFYDFLTPGIENFDFAVNIRYVIR